MQNRVARERWQGVGGTARQQQLQVHRGPRADSTGVAKPPKLMCTQKGETQLIKGHQALVQGCGSAKSLNLQLFTRKNTGTLPA